MSTYLGIDIGTQSVKALCYDAEQRCLAAVASSALDMISDGSGSGTCQPTSNIRKTSSHCAITNKSSP